MCVRTVVYQRNAISCTKKENKNALLSALQHHRYQVGTDRRYSSREQTFPGNTDATDFVVHSRAEIQNFIHLSYTFCKYRQAKVHLCRCPVPKWSSILARTRSDEVGDNAALSTPDCHQFWHQGKWL